MSVPKDPRMQMINMMYLVLMALLALNTSKSVLAAFRILDISMEEAVAQQDEKIASKYTTISALFEDDKTNDLKIGAFEKAKKIREKAQVVYDMIDANKEELVVLGGGYTDLAHGIMEIEQTDNGDIGPHLLGPPSEGGQGKGDEIREAMNACQAEWFEMIEGDTARVKLLEPIPEMMDIGDGEKISWSYLSFHLPLSACVATLTELGARLRSSELAMYNDMIQVLGADVISVDRMAPLVIPESNYLSPGATYRSEIFIAAWNSTQQPKVYIATLKDDIKEETAKRDSVTNNIIPGEYTTSGKEVSKEEATTYWPFVEDKSTLEALTLNQYSRGEYEQPSGAVGIKSYQGAIKIVKANGRVRWYPFETSFQVATKSDPVVSAMKMNVMYIGVDNPLNVVVPGYKPDKVKASMVGGGSLTQKGKGTEWIAKPTKSGKVQINMSVEEKDGSKSNMKGPEFRVKRVPDPIATVGGALKGGKTPQGKMKAQAGIVAVLDNFDFDFRFSVQSYEMTYIANRKDPFIKSGKGALFSGPIKNAIKGCKPKDKFFFTNIKVKGDDGSTRNLPSIVFDII